MTTALHTAALRVRDDACNAEDQCAALTEVTRIIARKPHDMAERTPELLRELLYLENRFDMQVTSCVLCHQYCY
jgi:Telomere length regulation protein